MARHDPRRRAVIAAAVALPVLGGCDMSGVIRPFSTLGDAIAAVQALEPARHTAVGAWSLAEVLDHAAQSVEYSMHGFPALKSAAFRATAGRAAFAWFDARGRMSHSRSEPIPGAPPLRRDLASARDRLVTALQAFDAHAGALAPHFAYGPLDKDRYARAHLMHLGDHWQDLRPAA
jgi:hypothetical protein